MLSVGVGKERTLSAGSELFITDRRFLGSKLTFCGDIFALPADVGSSTLIFDLTRDSLDSRVAPVFDFSVVTRFKTTLSFDLFEVSSLISPDSPIFLSLSISSFILKYSAFKKFRPTTSIWSFLMFLE